MYTVEQIAVGKAGTNTCTQTRSTDGFTVNWASTVMPKS